ncbi:MAG: hypothetical protein CSA18_02140 [Deltaproteobacteria bacterium]|nr:MAG: hypothetical protein CSB21_01325 [Deltaproteobacteria bacterium]PIE74936.1 MAG: hypothetical protein CSA18_02140 [Deltaproteobacteria bacterium]
MNNDLKLFKKTRLLLLDVDGILTSGDITYSQNGDELKSFSVRDGLGINLLVKSGIPVSVVTARQSAIVEKRCRELNISPVYQNIKKKIIAFEKIKEQFKIKASEICYMGDDLIDIPILKKCGIPVTVPDACEEAKKECLYITKKNAGKGAVREVCELILKSKSLWIDAINEYTGTD